MIEVNLLPQELRQRSKSTLKIDLAGLPIARIITITLISLIGIYLILSAAIQSTKIWLVKLNSTWQSMALQKKEVDAVKDEIAQLSNDINAVTLLSKQDDIWSRRLNAISDSITPGVWLTELYVEERKADQKAKTQKSAEKKSKAPEAHPCLNIKGTALMVGVDGMTSVGKFMNNLKANTGFFATFEDIQLGSIQRRFIKGVEVMDFTITCFLKRGQGE